MALAATDAPTAGNRLRGWRYPLAVGLLSRLLSFAVVGAIGLARREPGDSAIEAALAPFGMWDGVWYQRIAQFGYDPTVAHGNVVAFSPLYPELMSLVRLVLGWSYLAAGVAVSTACFLVALVLLHRLIARRSGERVARTAVWLTAFFPTAFLFSATYTESLYLLLTVAAFLLLEGRRLATASLVGMLAVLSRPTGIMLAPAFALRVWRDGGRRLTGGVVGRLLLIGLLPLAYALFAAYLYYRTGDPLATQSAQQAGWGRRADVLLVLGLPVAVLHGLYVAAHDLERLTYIADTAFAMTWALLLIEGAVRRRLPGEYLLYGGLAVALPVFAGTYLALPRYGMGIFVVMWLAAMHVAARPSLARWLRVAMPIALVATAVLVTGVEVYTP